MTALLNRLPPIDSIGRARYKRQATRRDDKRRVGPALQATRHDDKRRNDKRRYDKRRYDKRRAIRRYDKRRAMRRDVGGRNSRQSA